MLKRDYIFQIFGGYDEQSFRPYKIISEEYIT